MLRILGHLVVAVLLTALTQLGGIAWLASRVLPRPLVSFGLLYVALSVAAIWVAPLTGREVISCRADGPLQVQSWMYCALNRTYVTPELRGVLTRSADAIAVQHPGTVTQVLDAGFPFLVGMPLLPHLSHDDGEKVDLALFYQDQSGYLPGATRSPIGYFAFEQGASDCPKAWPTLRWDLDGVQGWWRGYDLDHARLRTALTILASDPAIAKIFLEPHLVRAVGVDHPKIRFQGCRAARHDDHIHVQL